jgi:gliding motility-associated-like protein
MKKTFLILFFCAVAFTAKADHITGGEMYYVHNGGFSYTVTLKLFMRCNSGRMFPDPAIISVFDKNGPTRMQDISAGISNRQTLQLNTFDPCISTPPTVCYEVAYYVFEVTVPPSATGYVIASQVNFRIRGINNLNQDQVGATYSCELPGTVPLPLAYSNSSAIFTGNDLVVVCASNYFNYSFAARDPDADELRYSFCEAYNSTSASNGEPVGQPPYQSVPYGGIYSASSPMGPDVHIDPATGMISGIAPPQGIYVVTVCVQEVRNGIVIATQRKDVQINVADCNIAAATLDKDYMLCGTTRRLIVNNISTSSLIVRQDWDVYNPAGTSIFSTTSMTLDYTLPPVNGIYSIRLIVNRGGDCSDTTTALVYLFPGLAPDFETTGICLSKSTAFTDKTTLISGSVNSWKWDFGEPSTITDVSTSRNDVYTYPAMGVKSISLMVTTTDGCRDTVYKSIEIIDKPPITLAFHDTLICIHDAVQLQASGTGNFTWSPLIAISNPNSPTPTVSPLTTTRYYADLETDGCRNRDSVDINVVDHVTLEVMRDTMICQGDTIRLHVTSDALHYIWTPSINVLTQDVRNPLVVTSAFTPYQVVAIIGSCSANGSIPVTTIPYPIANAGADTTICYNTAAQLHGLTDGNSWQWSPAATISSSSILDPIAHPVQELTAYVFTSFESTRGCPKPSKDTMYVTMLSRIIPFAGRDTSVIIRQPLQLHASGGSRYVWSPAAFLSDPNSQDPIATFSEPSERIRYKVTIYNRAGCFDSAFINVKVFATLPTVFVPTAFTPNNDGRNDVLRPVAVGMKNIQYFSIFNRWGHLVFTTAVNGNGWDGKIAGQDQGTNTYVWMVKAIDFNGKPYFEKGTVTLIR